MMKIVIQHNTDKTSTSHDNMGYNSMMQVNMSHGNV